MKGSSEMQPGLQSNGAIFNSVLTLRYGGLPRMIVRGSFTGKRYQFSPSQPVQFVDPKDAGPLLASRIFEVSQ
jgi:hypothetical protein